MGNENSSQFGHPVWFAIDMVRMVLCIYHLIFITWGVEIPIRVLQVAGCWAFYVQCAMLLAGKKEYI